MQYILVLNNILSYKKRQMDKLIDRYPYKKILYLNWYEAAIGHLLLFKYYAQKYSQNVYFLISEQGIMLKAVTLDYLKKADDQITKFFTARIQELQISGSSGFYNNILEDIKDQTEKLKDSRDCPYINLVYSEKIRNSCLAMKRLGYTKPYQNWQYHQRQKKGFCFLVVRPEHRWKQIANSIYSLVRKRESCGQKGTVQKSWQIEISYEKFIWFYLKESFKNFKKSLQIKQNKQQKYLTIIVKKDIQELSDLEKQIQTLTFFYKPTKPLIQNLQCSAKKIVVLSPLQIQKITELVYHQFGLTALAKQLRKKMTGYLVIGTSDTMEYYETQPVLSSQSLIVNPLQYKEDIIKIHKKKISTIVKLGRRHHIVSYGGANYVQMKLQKCISETQYQNILKMRLPCLPRYFYWYEPSQNNPSRISFLLREYYSIQFIDYFVKASQYSQIFLLSSLFNIVFQLHHKQIFLGSALNNLTAINDSNQANISSENLDIGSIYIDGVSDGFQEARIIIEPGPSGSKQEDIYRLSKILSKLLPVLKDENAQEDLKAIREDDSEFLINCIQLLDEILEQKG